MAGHSKWANIKHRKEAQDARKSALFAKLVKLIEVAARTGASPEANFKLKLAVERARAAGLPFEKIERAIKKGAGLEREANQLNETIYEGFGPGGVALLIEALTDNRNRTSAEIRHLFSQHGGNLAEAGSVLWQFSQKGIIEIEKAEGQGEAITLQAIEAGADEVEEQAELLLIYVEPAKLMAVKDELEKRRIQVRRAGFIWSPRNRVLIEQETEARKILQLMEALSGHPDVQEVYSNFEMPDALLESLV